ncbi:succinate dehydrogenase, hydrophobic membrane anchor protein [Luteimonas sp. M1R5S18]|jgi:succinate dehydrogenase / fumarate reductase membrane anchor subunit|uniref:Succinate dehydrogenase hydrophobic membrane anchor subunit n=1 Tax=Luteimonas rhizosphaericola TaxID=3042024 RepID=A0ABT6JH22_9GAMM|nr:succinate dehydrogenase, hydrophobic membrane anchor protein [Luteimonas rhizosphaericola]MDH5829985.1 succinate dehydrogenase, hydrophobic membrane anchor protein [Luteimonas rhizosphaericola]
MSSDPNASTPPDYRTPIARARGLGSGKTGTGHFWWQRVTAVALVPLVAWFIGTVLSLVGADLATVYATLSRPWTAILFAVFAIAMFWHAKLGLQVIIEDYVHERALEIALQLLVTFACAVGALASLYAIARIAMLG